ncbi:MAG: phosphate acyltransferase PlsX [Verrucomicrobia bacterium]|nr:MAG: phosphate acyltransferase PlsX [Verrucomicrobiota bacterium]
MSPTAGQRIAVDAMGSDLGPAEMVAAVALALRNFEKLEPIVLVGNENTLQPLLAAEGIAGHPKLSIHHAPSVIEMTDKPLQALKRKKDSSMLQAIELVKTGGATAVVSCGNTGALMAGGTLRLRTLDGIERPALATVIPNRNGRFILIDAGANPDARPEHLLHNAILGRNYARVVLGIANPRIGLLTIGTEEGKGNELINDAHDLLKRVGDQLNYQGPIEGFHVFDNAVDVIVCDGFTGNVVLKTSESLFKMLTGFIRDEMTATPVRKIGALLSRGAFKAVKTQLNPDEFGGAPLLGLRGNVFKAHGSSNRNAVMHAIRIAHEMIARDLNDHIVEDAARIAGLLAPTV